MPFFAVSLESLLIFLVIVLLSALSNWLKQRKEQALRRQRGETPQRTTAGQPPPRPLVAPETAQPRPGGWQEELRRMLEGEPEAPPPPAAVPAPAPTAARPLPLVREPAPAAPAPPVLTVPSRPVSPRPEPALAIPSSVEAPVLIPPGSHFPLTTGALDAQPAPTFVLAPLETSATAYRRARQLDERTAVRLRHVVERTERPVPARPMARRLGAVPEITQALAQLRHPRTARQTILASVMLGPPKAFEV